MQNFELNFNAKTEHTLIGHREGDWIIFTCPKCKGFQKRYNWKTRKMITIGAGEKFMVHAGSYAPAKASIESLKGN